MAEATPPIGAAQTEPAESGCPMRIKPPVEGGSNRDWWPNAVNLKILQKDPDVINPLGADFDYRAAVQPLVLAQRLRMHPEHAGRHADEIEVFVHTDGVLHKLRRSKYRP